MWFPSIFSKISLYILSFFASIKEQIIPWFLVLKLRASSELIPILGISKLSINAFNVEIPIRIPVKEPGPISETSRLISVNCRFVSSRICFIIGSNVSEWVT